MKGKKYEQRFWFPLSEDEEIVIRELLISQSRRPGQKDELWVGGQRHWGAHGGVADPHAWEVVPTRPHLHHLGTHPPRHDVTMRAGES